MIKHFEGDTADEIWRDAATALMLGDDCLREDSRLGPMHEYLHCTLHLKDPRQRWVLSRKPALNPAFAIAELIWILQGRNDAAFPNYWNPALPNFAGSDDTYYGAYGHRLRNNLAFDQIENAFQVLAANPHSRQVVLQIWDGRIDFPTPSGTARAPDIPCNIVAMPKVRDGRLEWSQIMRSNDLFLGTPHNFVQFTSLQEIMAGWLGFEVGSFLLMSDSLHIYEHDIKKLSISDKPLEVRNTDSLALPKKEYAAVLSDITNAMDELCTKTLSRARFMQLVETCNMPKSWHNLLCIAAADAARRRSWNDETESASSQCTNPALVAGWSAWVERCTSR